MWGTLRGGKACGENVRYEVCGNSPTQKELTLSEDNRHMYNINYTRPAMIRSHQRVKNEVWQTTEKEDRFALMSSKE